MKIIGIIFIISASLFATICYEKKIKEKITTLEVLLDFTSYIENQISLFSLPIDSIFSTYKPRSEIIRMIKEKNYEALSIYEKEFSYKIINFFDNIGNGYKNQQIKMCKVFHEELNQELITHKNDIKNKIKIFRTMALFISACIIIFIV